MSYMTRSSEEVMYPFGVGAFPNRSPAFQLLKSAHPEGCITSSEDRVIYVLERAASLRKPIPHLGGDTVTTIVQHRRSLHPPPAAHHPPASQLSLKSQSASLYRREAGRMGHHRRSLCMGDECEMGGRGTGGWCGP